MNTKKKKKKKKKIGFEWENAALCLQIYNKIVERQKKADKKYDYE